MDGETRSRGPLIAIVVAGVVLVGLLVLGAAALFGNSDPDSPTTGPGPTSGLPTPTTTSLPSSSALPTSTTPTTTAPAEGSSPEVATDAGAETPSGLPGYDSEACALFRQLLEIVDDAQLRAGAAQAGCI